MAQTLSTMEMLKKSIPTFYDASLAQDARELIKPSRTTVCRVWLGVSRMEYLHLKGLKVKNEVVCLFERLNNISKITDYNKSMLSQAIEDFNVTISKKGIDPLLKKPIEIIHRDISTGLGMADTYHYYLRFDGLVLDAGDKPVIHLSLAIDAPKRPIVKRFDEEQLISGFVNHYSFYINGRYEKDEDAEETFGLVFTKLIAVKKVGDKENDFVRIPIIEL